MTDTRIGDLMASLDVTRDGAKRYYDFSQPALRHVIAIIHDA